MKIIDPLIKPFEINVDENQFTVYLPVEAKSGKQKGEIFEMNKGYFSSLEGALHFIIKQKLISDDKVLTIKKFIEEYEKMFLKFSKTIKM